MAYTMTHILIAEKLQHELGREVDYPAYILGTIAPDAVHANPNFSVELKERSHLFPENLKWGKVTNEEQILPWLENIKDYYIKNRDMYNIDFLSGYIIHLLADVYNSVHFYGPFLTSLNGDIKEKIELFKRENYIVNYYLYSLFSKKKNLLEILHAGKAVTLAGVIEKEDIERRIGQLFEFEFKYWDVSHIAEQQICKIEDMEEVIQKAALYIKKELIHSKSVSYFLKNS